MGNQYYYLKVGKADELDNRKERRIFRFFEMLPGLCSWLTLILMVIVSWQWPVVAAIFIIVFDTYWLIKTTYFSWHAAYSFKKVREHLKKNWLTELKNLSKESYNININDWRDIYHLVIFPMVDESYAIVSSTFEALSSANYPLDRFIVVLATEERAQDKIQSTIDKVKKEYDGLEKLFIQQEAENKRVKKELGVLEKEKNEKQAKMDELKNLNKMLKGEYSYLQEEKAELESLSKAQEEENKKLQGLIKEFEQAKADYANLETLFKQQQGENRQLTEQIAMMEQEKDTKQGRMDELKELNDNLKEEFLSLQKEQTGLESVANEQERENKKLKEQLDKEKEDFGKRLLDFYKQEEEILNQRIDEYQKRQQELKVLIKQRQ